MGGFLPIQETGTPQLFPSSQGYAGHDSAERMLRRLGLLSCTPSQTFSIVLYVSSDGRPEAIQAALRSACGLARHMQLQPGVLDVLALLLQGNSTYQVPICLRLGMTPC